METIKSRLKEILKTSTKPKQAKDDLAGELGIVRQQLNGALVRADYQGLSPEKAEIKRLVEKAEKISPEKTLDELEPLTRTGGRKTTKTGRRPRKTRTYSRRR